MSYDNDSLLQVYGENWEKINGAQLIERVPDEKDLLDFYKKSATLGQACFKYFILNRMFYKKKILDAGCGTGYGTEILVKGKNNVIGIDSDPKVLEYAKKNFSNNTYLLRDFLEDDNLEALGKFDVIVNYLGFQNFSRLNNKENAEFVIRRFKNMLNVGSCYITYFTLSVKNINFDLEELLKEIFDNVFIFIQYRLGLFLVDYPNFEESFKNKIFFCYK